MTLRQQFLKLVYPVLMWWKGKKTGTTNNLSPSHTPPVSFYSLKATLNNGNELDFASLAGKKVLLVNTASNCGFTPQYDDLQKLYEQYRDKLVIIGFPANDFKEQEKGSDEEIAAFCKVNFGVSFPLVKKTTVINSPQQHAVYQWLTDPAKNGWNKKPPSWNFSKYLINDKGLLIHYFGPAVSPLSKEIVDELS